MCIDPRYPVLIREWVVSCGSKVRSRVSLLTGGGHIPSSAIQVGMGESVFFGYHRKYDFERKALNRRGRIIDTVISHHSRLPIVSRILVMEWWHCVLDTNLFTLQASPVVGTRRPSLKIGLIGLRRMRSGCGIHDWERNLLPKVVMSWPQRRGSFGIPTMPSCFGVRIPMRNGKFQPR